MARCCLPYLAVCLCIAFAGGATAAEPAEKVVLGYISAGKVYALSRTLDPVGPQEIGGGCILHGNTYYLAQRPLVPLRGVKRHGRVDEIHSFGDGDVPLRWRVRQGWLFESSQFHLGAGFLQTSLKWFEKWWASQDKDVRTEDDGGLLLMNYMFQNAGDDCLDWTAEPVKKLLDDVFDAETSREKEPHEPKTSLVEDMRFATRRVSYDLLPSEKERTARLFWLHNGWMHEAAGRLRRINKDRSETTWSKPDRYRVPFKGHFHVFARGKELYFVTNAGDIYHATEPGKDKARVVKKVETLGCAANLILHDDTSGKTFAFALPRPSKAGVTAGLFVELASGAKPREFAARSVATLKRKEPMTTVWDCARLLLAEKLIAEK